MRPILIRVTAFSIGVLVFWLLHFLRVFTAIPAGASVPSDDTMRALRMAGSLAVASGLGAFLGLGAARGASRSVPVWLAAPVGLLFGFLTLSVLGRVRVTALPILAGMMVFLLIVAFAAAFSVWLFAMTLQLARRHFVDVKREFIRINSTGAERLSFWLALSPWLLATTQLLRAPGFG